MDKIERATEGQVPDSEDEQAVVDIAAFERTATMLINVLATLRELRRRTEDVGTA